MCQLVPARQISQTHIPDGVADDREVVGDDTEAAVSRIQPRAQRVELSEPGLSRACIGDVAPALVTPSQRGEPIVPSSAHAFVSGFRVDG
jgi:hypothetical protein